ncbi:helix-turn-helix domain-containing protein [Castellaniella sp.]|uniref:helix-turn-helix domain-containing protein n=1 Tax=Castellaniella sp. TaxID=1955812 RepID=UPI002AFEC506|nr:helix-turn-helix domain-containing protein [Castellaniella sp.]
MAFKPLMPKSQLTLLIEHLKKKGSISGIEAAALFRIRSLSRRINDLEARGHRIERVQAEDTTGQRYVRYYLVPSSESRPA